MSMITDTSLTKNLAATRLPMVEALKNTGGDGNRAS